MNGERQDKFRHEYKYLISEQERALIESRIKHLVPKDKHVIETGYYNISSLYFDDIYNTCYYENENGTDPREKFRIRIYNHGAERITLECKRKERGKTLKTSCPLTREQCELIMAGGVPRIEADTPALLRKLIIQMLERRMRPKVIVEYDRVPYVYANGNVRITFDMHLSSSKETERFLEGAVSKRPVMPQGKLLMEVKWDEYLPDVIRNALQIDNLTQTAYSKYYLCRKYDI